MNFWTLVRKSQLFYLLSLSKICFIYTDVWHIFTVLIDTDNADQYANQYANQYVNCKTSDLWQHMIWSCESHDLKSSIEFLQMLQKLINDNHILSYFLISYLTHYMQSLNVDVFQSYKHWHEVAMWNALTNFSFEYNI